MAATTRDEIDRIAEWVGRHADRRRRRARLGAVRRRVAVRQRRQRRVPRRRALPDGRAVLRRAGPPARRGRRRRRRQHPPLRARTSAAAARSCPSTTSSCSTRPTCLEDVMSDTVGVQIAPGRFVDARPASMRRILDDPALIAGVVDARRRRCARRSARTSASACRSPYPDDGAGGARSRPAPGSTRAARARSAAIETAGRGRQAAQAARPADDRPGDRARSTSRSVGARRATSTSSSGSPEHAAARDRAARRRTGARATGCGRSARRCSPARRSRRRCLQRVGLPPSDRRRRRRRQPVRLRPQRAALLRDAPARPAVRRLPRRRARRAGRADHRRRRAHAGAVHELEGDGRSPPRRVRDRVDVPILTQRDLPKPALVRALRRRRGDVRCSPPPASSRASTCPGRR